MTTTIGQMSPAELRDLIESIVEQKLLEILADPDQGLELDEALIKRLQRQQVEVAAGEHGVPMDVALEELGLN
jgi:hypothetical protein